MNLQVLAMRQEQCLGLVLGKSQMLLASLRARKVNTRRSATHGPTSYPHLQMPRRAQLGSMNVVYDGIDCGLALGMPTQHGDP